MVEVETSIAPAPAESRPPVVLQVLPRLVTGGVERGTVEIAGGLVRAGWTAIVASAGGPMVREIERAGGVHVPLPLASKNPLVIRANIARLGSIISRYGVDIVHARSRAPAWSAAAAARRAGVAFVTTFHNAYGGSESWLKRRYNAVMARGDRVIAISEFVAAHVAAVYGVESERLRVIPRGVDFARFDPDRVSADRVVQLARAWNLPDGVPVVMLPGRLARWKGHPVLVQALTQLAGTRVHCLFVGSGPTHYRLELERLIARAPEGCTVQLVDECRDMPAAYMLADVVVSASTEPEGFGRVIAEAQAMGRPVIATAHGGACETVLPGETGWLVPPGDAAALGMALAEAISLTPEFRIALAVREVQHIRDTFGTDRMIAATLAVYQELLSDAPASAHPAGHAAA